MLHWITCNMFNFRLHTKIKTLNCSFTWYTILDYKFEIDSPYIQFWIILIPLKTSHTNTMINNCNCYISSLFCYLYTVHLHLLYIHFRNINLGGFTCTCFLYNLDLGSITCIMVLNFFFQNYPFSLGHLQYKHNN